jgi:hypothetical protein
MRNLAATVENQCVARDVPRNVPHAAHHSAPNERHKVRETRASSAFRHAAARLGVRVRVSVFFFQPTAHLECILKYTGSATARAPHAHLVGLPVTYQGTASAPHVHPEAPLADLLADLQAHLTRTLKRAQRTTGRVNFETSITFCIHCGIAGACIPHSMRVALTSRGRKLLGPMMMRQSIVGVR